LISVQERYVGTKEIATEGWSSRIRLLDSTLADGCNNFEN
jgi:hypothetical protein